MTPVFNGIVVAGTLASIALGRNSVKDDTKHTLNRITCGNHLHQGIILYGVLY